MPCVAGELSSGPWVLGGGPSWGKADVTVSATSGVPEPAKTLSSLCDQPQPGSWVAFPSFEHPVPGWPPARLDGLSVCVALQLPVHRQLSLSQALAEGGDGVPPRPDTDMGRSRPQDTCTGPLLVVSSPKIKSYNSSSTLPAAILSI